MEPILDGPSSLGTPRRPGAMQGQIEIAEDFDTTSPDVIALFLGEETDDFGMSINVQR